MKNRTLTKSFSAIAICLLLSACGEDPFVVKGNVLGLTGSVKLILNGGETLDVDSDGAFEIGSSVPETIYSLAILNHPEQQTCLVVAKGAGPVPEDDGDNITPIVVEGAEISCADGWMGTRQWGTYETDELKSAALDSSDNIHMVGYRQSFLISETVYNPFTGEYENRTKYTVNAWLSRLNGSQDIILKSKGDSAFRSIVVDELDNSYIVGYMSGNWDDQVNHGGTDVLITKLDASGQFLWTRLLGGGGNDDARDVALNADGQLIVVGFTNSPEFEGTAEVGEGDAFVMQLDTDGNVGWVSMLGSTQSDSFSSVAIDALGDVIVSGTSFGDLAGASNNGERDAFLAKYDTTGELQWLTMVGGSGYELINRFNGPGGGRGLIIDKANNIILVGGTRSDDFYGQASIGGIDETDAFIVKLGSDGDLQWTTRMGDVKSDMLTDVIEDSEGNLIVTGYTYVGDWLELGPGVGSEDAFVMKLNSLGDVMWTETFGSVRRDIPSFLLKDRAEHYYMGGATGGSLPGFINSKHPINNSLINSDAFLAKFDIDGNFL